MHILMIIDGLSGGGAEKTVLTLSKGLLEMQHKVSLFSLSAICDYPIPKGINFKIIQDKSKKPWRKLTEISRRAHSLDNAIYETERNEKFDIIFSHLHKTDRIVAHSRILNRNKVWFCVHTMLSFSYLYHRNKFSRWLKYLKIRYTYKNRNVIAVSWSVLHDISNTMKISLRYGVVIYNPFDIDAIQIQSKQSFEMEGKDYLIHVGRFHKNKRHDRLLRAYALSKIDIPLIMIGNYSDNKVMQLKFLAEKLGISEKIFFYKFLLNPYPWIKGARILVLSSDYEGFGNVLVEAIICQTPIVSTKCPGGPQEILIGPLARGLSELSDESLAKTLLDIYNRPPVVDMKIISSYEIRNICQQYIRLIKRCY